ncbi:MAG: hypothetical protein AB7K04_06895 [Pseudorhodoplanes sp.]
MFSDAVRDSTNPALHLRAPSVVPEIRSRPTSNARTPVADRGRNIAPKRPVSAELVLRTFNTWAFKREQPTEPQLLLKIIADAIALNAPVPFVMYWGKGPRAALGGPDVRCLDYLASLVARVRDVYKPGVAITLIFTDTHATLNGHTPESMRSYFRDVEAEAQTRGFEGCLLSRLITGIDPADCVEEMPEAMRHSLFECAKKWFRGEGTAEEGAQQYYQMNMVEKRAVERAFPNAVFVTFNGSEYRSLFPRSLPVFYMYSLRRGFGVKPWFLPDDAVEPAPAPAQAAP